MAETERPQYYENTLTPLPINPATLIDTLRELREAVYNGAELVHTNEPIPDEWSAGGMFKHFPGILPLRLLPKMLWLDTGCN
jgi:hypothetical protein